MAMTGEKHLLDQLPCAQNAPDVRNMKMRKLSQKCGAC